MVFLQLQQLGVILNMQKIACGKLGKEIVFYYAIGAQSAQLQGISLYEVGMCGKQNLKILLINSSGEQELCNLQNCKYHAPHKPPSWLEGCTPFYYFKGFSIRANFGF